MQLFPADQYPAGTSGSPCNIIAGSGSCAVLLQQQLPEAACGCACNATDAGGTNVTAFLQGEGIEVR
eukprot:COSAG05_NODE_2447_length_3056_cov_1.630707_3_plen_67_part_00